MAHRTKDGERALEQAAPLPDDVRRLARSLGDASADGGERLLRTLDRTMQRTRALFDRLVT